MRLARIQDASGFTIVELLISMVIIGVAVAGTLLTATTATRHSFDPVIQSQSTAIARAYLEEIMLKPYYDPDDTGLDPTQPCAAGTPDPFFLDATETGRASYDNVGDYTAIVNQKPPQDQDGNDLTDSYPALSPYEVDVAIAEVNDFGPAGDTIMALEIDVTVTHTLSPTSAPITLRANRACY